MNKNFLISTGGSGGHVIPATIVYEHLNKNNNIIISSDRRGLKYLNKDIYQLEIIDTPRLNNIFFLPINIIIIIYLIFRSYLLLKKRKICKVFSTGGYMSLPIILAAKLLKLNIYLIEPNHVLGRANRFFLNACKKIFCYSDAIKNFPTKYKFKIVTINPFVKEYVYKLSLQSDIKKKFTILIVGGSQGASVFDNNLKDEIIEISKKTPVKIIQQTKKKNCEYFTDLYSKNNIENKIFSYDENLVDLMSEADLCITRAGASTLAELSVLNTPFIAVPLPTSKDRHQFENASFYEKKNCCWLIDQINFEQKIGEVLKDILEKKSDLLKKKENLKKLNYQNTWINVNQKILEIINEN